MAVGRRLWLESVSAPAPAGCHPWGMKAALPLASLALALAPLGSVPALSADPSPPRCEWAFAGGGEAHDKTRGIAFDGGGNVLLASECVGDATFGELVHRSAGGMDMCLVKLDASGRPLWVASLGGSLTDRAYGVAVDADGNVYVTGHYESADAVAAGKKLPNAGGYEGYLAKFSPDGGLLWVETFGGAGYDYGHAVAVDPAGDVVVSGAVQGRAAFGEETVGEDGSHRALFCAKFDPDGGLKWLRATGDGLSGSGHGVAVDASGRIYVGGNVGGAGAFGGLEVEAPTQAAFAAGLSPGGEVLWVSAVPGTTSAGYHEIACDAEGRVWGAGMFKGEVAVAGETFRSGGEKDSDGLLVHLDAEGRPVWAKHLQGAGTDYCLGVAVDEGGRAYFCGNYAGEASLAGLPLVSRGSGDLFLAGFAADGRLLWAETGGGERGDSAYPLAYRAPGLLALAGAFGGPARVGAHELAHRGGNDLHASLWRLVQP